MIEVSVAGQEQAQVLQSESQLRDAGLDERGGLAESGVQQDEPVRSGDEERRDVGGADVVEVSGNPEGRERPVPLGVCRSVLR